MKSAQKLIVVDVKDVTAAITIGTLTNEGLVVEQGTLTSGDGVPAQAFIIGAVTQSLAALSEQGFAGRVAVIVPEQVILRFATAQKAKKNAGVGASVSAVAKAVYSALYFPWMERDGKGQVWQQTLSAFANVFAGFPGTILWVNARELYRWEVFYEGTLNDETVAALTSEPVSFVAGVCAEKGLVVGNDNGKTVTPKTFYNERVQLTATSYQTRDNGKVWRLFADRFVSWDNGGHERAAVAGVDMAREFPGISDSGAALVDAIRLRALNTRALPSRGVSRIIVKDSQEG